MKKIKEGKLKVFVSKKDAIDRLMQLQGPCKDINDRNCGSIEFYCNKNGKIKIECCEQRLSLNFKNSKILTKLYGVVTQCDNETYINYFTSLKNINIFIWISFLLIATVISMFFMLLPINKTKVLALTVCCIIALVFQVISILEEKTNPDIDSDTLIKILENKIDIVNNWKE